MGAQPVTFLGLAGVGDLILTCTGVPVAKRTLGKKIAGGRKAKEVLAEQKRGGRRLLHGRAGVALAQMLGVDAPIIEQVYHVLYEDRELSRRDPPAHEPRAERRVRRHPRPLTAPGRLNRAPVCDTSEAVF